MNDLQIDNAMDLIAWIYTPPADTLNDNLMWRYR